MTQSDLFEHGFCTRSAPLVLNKFKGREFSADQLGEAIDLPHNRNLIGRLLGYMAGKGYIKCVGVRKSDRPSRNCGIQRVWVTVD